MRTRRIEGEGRPVVFVHAALSDGSQWDEIVALAPPGVRSVVVDLPDFGYDAPGTTLESIERSFRALIAAERERGPVTLIGHSFGGWLVARVLHDLGDVVRRAVLIAGVASLSAEMAAGYHGLAAGLESGRVERAAAMAGIVDAALGARAPSRLREQLLGTVARYPDDRLLRALRIVAALGDPAALVAPFDVPAQIVHARDDRSVPLASAHELLALGSRAALDVWPSDSHMLPLDEPERIARLAYE